MRYPQAKNIFGTKELLLMNWRNIFILIVFILAWILVYVVYPYRIELKDVSIELRIFMLVIIPFTFGLSLYLLLHGVWFKKVWYMIAMPIIPIVVLFIVWGRDIVGENFAWLWIYAAAPLLPYWVGAGVASILYGLSQRRNRN